MASTRGRGRRSMPALEARRDVVRAEVRAALAAPEAVGFLFDLGAFIEGRGWLVAVGLLASRAAGRPDGEVAPGRLARRHRKVMKAGRRLRELDAGGAARAAQGAEEAALYRGDASRRSIRGAGRRNT